MAAALPEPTCAPFPQSHTCYNDFMARMRTASDSNVVAFVLRCKMKATYTQSAELQDDKAKADPTRARCFRNPTHAPQK